MRKFVSIAGLVCIALTLAGCSVRMTEHAKDPIVTAVFEKKTGEIATLAATLNGDKLPLLFGISFEKSAGKLEVAITDPSGAEAFRDTVQANDTYMHPKEVKEPLRYNWGFYRFNKVMDASGTYNVTVMGEDATGKVQISPMTNSDTYFTGFTGTAVKVTADVTDTSKEIGFNLQALPTPDNKGVIMAKIFDPDGIEIRSTRLTADPNNQNSSMLNFWEKPAKTGTYTAIVEGKDATGSALGAVYTEKPIPFLAFVKPILFILLGFALYFMIKPRDRKVMVWGGMLWMIATFLISVLTGIILKDFLAGILIGPYASLTLGLINTISLAVIYVLIVWFGRFVAEVKNASPTELVAFVFGFAFVSPLLTGLSDLMQIVNLNSSMVPAFSGMMIPGYYASGSLAAFDIGASIVTLIGNILGTIAALTIFLWVLRQREQVSKSTLWLAALGAIGIKVLSDAALLYFRQAMGLILVNRQTVAFKATFGLASPEVEAIASIILLVIIGTLVVLSWRKIMGLALKACPVTIDDFAKKEAK